MKIILFFAAALCIHASLFAQTVSDSAVYDVSGIPLDQDNGRIAISRSDPNNIVIGAASDGMETLGMPAYYTTDRGTSWQSTRVPLPADSLNVSGRPALASGDGGIFYYAYVTNDGADSDGAIIIASSSDAGKTWKNISSININVQHYGFPDEPFIAVYNLPGTHHWRIYAVWDEFYSDPNINDSIGGIYISSADDKGVTWSTPKQIGTSNDYQEVHIGKEGAIYISSSDSTFSNIGGVHQLFVSNDGGVTFSTPNVIGGFTHYPFSLGGLLDTSYTELKGIQGFAAQTYISFDVDWSNNRIHAVYSNWNDVESISELFYSYSDNNGVKWSSPVGISEFATTDLFDPSVVVDQKTHKAYVTFYTSESDPNNIKVAPARVLISDMTERQLSAPFDPLFVEQVGSNPPYIGDHTSSDADNNVFAATWTQNRPNHADGDVWVFVSTSNFNDVQPVLVHSSHTWLSAPYPNPVTGNSIRIRYYIPHPSEISFDLFDATGRFVKHLTGFTTEEGSYSAEFSIEDISAGTYLIRMNSNIESHDQKIVITK